MPTDFETENESVDTAVVVRYDVIVVTPNAWLFRSDWLQPLLRFWSFGRHKMMTFSLLPLVPPQCWSDVLFDCRTQYATATTLFSLDNARVERVLQKDWISLALK